MNDIQLKKPTTTSDALEGLNDGNIETYKNTPLLSLTKEELQNSTDQAVLDENGQPKRVIVEFNDFILKKENFPKFEDTRDVYYNERHFWDNYLKNDRKAIDFFDNALKILDSNGIRCLRISDFNTTGLNGIHSETSSPWNDLVKNKGVSDKPGYSGGSFGIGKDAAFACSQLRIVFYNTVNQENESGFQGCMKVPNYRKDCKTFTGRNFYCKDSDDDSCSAIDDNVSLDSNYKRNTIGMDKYIIGFDRNLCDEDLKRNIIVSSIENFLLAFYFDKLEIRYGTETVNKDNLDCRFDALKDSLSKLSIENLETLKNPDEVVKLSMFEEDDILIYIKLDPNYGRRASVIRQNGMKVFDKGHISARIGFNAIVYLAKNEVNKYFKVLENQEHNSWSIDRAKDPKLAFERQKMIFDTVRDKVKQLNGALAEGSVDSDGLGEYLPFAYITGKKDRIENLSNEIEDTKKKIRESKKQTQQFEFENEVEYQEDENGNLTALPAHHGDNDTPGPTPPIPPFDNHIDVNDNDDGSPVSQSDDNGDFTARKECSSKDLKYHLIKKNDYYTLKVISKETFKKGFFEFSISGEDSSANIEAIIEKASINGIDVSTKNNKIQFLNINKEELYKIDFKLKMSGEWALEVKAYESKN